MTRHFLDVDDLEPEELDAVLEAAGIPFMEVPPLLRGRGAALLFEKPSLRTRSSMEVAIAQLGGHPVTIVGDEIGIDTRETAEDIARVLSRYHAVI
ncbi:MAG: ornithine carbamoyltransferase, partial [Actinobacteria bacterium]